MEEIELADNPLGWSQTSRKDLLPLSKVNARCTACNQVFSVSRNFDSHRKWNSKKQESYCLDPESVGLTLSDKLLWIVEQNWAEDLD